MTDTVVDSLSNSNMMDYPLFLQAPSGASSLNYSINDLRLLGSIATSGRGGVKDGTHFLVSSGPSTGQMTVAAGTGVTYNNGEYYAFRSIGNVVIPVYSNGHAFTVTHQLCAQVFDKQLSYSSSNGWGFVLVEDVTGAGAAVPTNAIPICAVTVTPGQTSGYALIDTRYPYNDPMVCAVGSPSLSLPDNTPVYISWTNQYDDLWNMWNTGTNTKVYIKQPGIYTISLRLNVPSVDYTGNPARYAKTSIRINGTNLYTETRQAATDGVTCHAFVTGYKIIPSGSTYVEGVVEIHSIGDPVPCSAYLTVQRTEYRSS